MSRDPRVAACRRAAADVEGPSRAWSLSHRTDLLEREPDDDPSDRWDCISPLSHHGARRRGVVVGGVGGRDSTVVSSSD